MATPLTDSINALTAYANEVTGGSDTNLSDAVHTLASGYGGGSDTAIIDSNTKYLNISAQTNDTRAVRMFAFQPFEVIVFNGYMDFTGCGYMCEFMGNLKAAIFPDATILSSYLFWDTNQNHTKPSIDLHKKNTFSNATPFRLEQGADIILRNSEMSTTGFTATTCGMSSGIKFFVPSVLRADYLADSNWSTFGSDRILPIEGTIYEDIDWWKALV